MTVCLAFVKRKSSVQASFSKIIIRRLRLLKKTWRTLTSISDHDPQQFAIISNFPLQNKVNETKIYCFSGASLLSSVFIIVVLVKNLISHDSSMIHHELCTRLILDSGCHHQKKVHCSIRGQEESRSPKKRTKNAIRTRMHLSVVKIMFYVWGERVHMFPSH